MNFSEKELEELAAKYAGRLLERARRNEPPVTETLQEIAAVVSAQMVGLENRFKSAESLAEKFVHQAAQVFQYLSIGKISKEENIERTISELAEQINDVLRYTFLFPVESYVFGFKQTLETLRRQNFEILPGKTWNAWKNIGTSFDKGYRGINVTMISSHEQKFELQFHTAESFRLKREMHHLYKEVRLKKMSRRRKAEIAEKMITFAKRIAVPPGVTNL